MSSVSTNSWFQVFSLSFRGSRPTGKPSDCTYARCRSVPVLVPGYLLSSSWRIRGRFRGPCGRHALAWYISIGGSSSAAGRWLLRAPWLQLPRKGVQKLLLLLKHGPCERSQCQTDPWLIPRILAIVHILSLLLPQPFRPGRWWIIGLSLGGDLLRPGLWHAANDCAKKEVHKENSARNVAADQEVM